MGGQLPEYESVAGVLITGSHAMLTDHLPWNESAARWLAGAVKRQIPCLGICYGHHLLAYALGGEVLYNPNGKEYGTLEITLTPEAVSDPLFGSLPAHPMLHVSHSQTVSRLPVGALHLAFSHKDAHQAFRFNQNAWGTQFHPEFDAEITRTYIEHSSAELLKQGDDPASLSAACQDTPYGSQILSRFVEIVRNNGF